MQETDTLFMNIQQPWFDLIEQKQKTIEGRRGPPGKFDAWVGKQIMIRNPEDGKVFRAKIVTVRHWITLEKYFDGEDWQDFAPHASSKDDAWDKYQEILHKGVKLFAPLEIAMEGGINAVVLEVV